MTQSDDVNHDILVRLDKEIRLLNKFCRTLKLKPCPFCGRKAEIIQNSRTRPDRFQVGCVNPACVIHPVATYGYGGFVEEIPELVKSWNKRTSRRSAQ